MSGARAEVIAFDVFGTLVDPAGLVDALRPVAGQGAAATAAEWRRRQVEYLFRRAAMGRFRRFAEVTADALVDTARALDLDLADAERDRLVGAWFDLPAKAGARETLAALTDAGHRLVAFSNGGADDVDALLTRAGLREPLAAVLSVEASASCKPAAVVYHDMLARTQTSAAGSWLVSANCWDAIGARAAGLQSVWLAAGRPVEQWEWQPTACVEGITDLLDRPPALAVRQR